MIIAEAVMVPLSAHLATLPVAAAISGQVSMVGVLTNAVAGPFVGPATVLGFAAAGLSLLSPSLAGLVGWAACWSAQPILWTAQVGARLPGAAWTWPTSPVALGLLAAGCLLLALLMPRIARSPWVTLGLAVLMIIGVLRAPVQPGWPPRNWLMVACDVGQGDGLAVRSGAHQAVVIDTGPDPAPMRRCLDQLGIRRVPLLILTHFHADHVGGLGGVFSGRQVERIWTSPYASPPAEAADIEQTARAKRIPVDVPAVGARVRVGAVDIAVVGPVDRRPTPLLSDEGQSSLENDLSITAVITVDGVRVLFSGDLEPEEQRQVLATGADLHADVLKVPHHGSSRQDPAFIAATRARFAIASAGVDNSYGHPAPRTMRLLQGDGMTPVCTCTLGSIAVTRSDGRLAMVSQRGP
jgi:competence protein ComEC